MVGASSGDGDGDEAAKGRADPRAADGGRTARRMATRHVAAVGRKLSGPLRTRPAAAVDGSRVRGESGTANLKEGVYI